MRRAGLVVLALLALPACKKKREPEAGATPAGSDAAARAPGTPPDLSFIHGDVVTAGSAAGKTVVRRLDAATGQWLPLGDGSANLYPTGLRRQGGLLVIATTGETEADHQEQLAIVRDRVVERFGPVAQMVRNPTATADGKTLVIEASTHSYRDLYALAADGSATQLTNNPEGNFEPALTPDGTAIAYASSRDGNAELYSQTLAGGASLRLTDSPRDDWNPAWSPDGKTLAFLSDRDGSQRAYLMASGGAIRLTAETAAEAVEDQPRWSPDGKTLAYLRGLGTSLTVVVVDVTTGKARTLTPTGAADLDFAWSPEGSHLAVIRHADGDPRGAATIVFVRVSDGAAVATDDTDASQVRWIAPAPASSP